MAADIGLLRVAVKVDLIGALAESIRKHLTPDAVRELAEELARHTADD
jgi:hypothetical protein